MKKTVLTFVATITVCGAFAQTNTFPLSGNVGIGTTTPASALDIQQSVNSASSLSISNNNTGTSAQSTISAGNGTSGITLYSVGTGYTPAGEFQPNWAVVRASIASPGLSLSSGNSTGVVNFFIGANEKMRILANGYVGIGTTSPGALLNLLGSGSNSNGILDVQSTDVGALGTLARIGYYQYTSQDNAGSYFQSWGMRYNGSDHLWYRTYMAANNYLPYTQLSTTGTIVFGGAASNLTTNSNPTLNPVMTVNVGTPSVSIGTTNPHGFMLAVNGSAIATSMTVQLNSYWPDYVFEKDYQLPSLEYIRTYIDKNHRLPEMPSASEIEQNGLNLGETNKLLTKKVEELTLYLIEQQKINQSLQEQINDLKKTKH